MSVEPQVEAIDLADRLPSLDWVIQGGESGGNARPFAVEWAGDLLDQCDVAKVPYFLKQLGADVLIGERRVRLGDRHGGDWDQWHEVIRRRDFPEP